MRRVTILITTLLVSISTVFAQETIGKVKEVGLTFSNISSFGATYRFGNENAVWRLNTIIGDNSLTNDFSEGTSSNYEEENKDASINISFGRELRKSVADKLEFRYGLDLSLGYSSYKSEYIDMDEDIEYLDRSNRITPGVNFVLGFNYLLSDAFVLGAEIKPNFSYSSEKGISEILREDEKVIEDFSSSAINYGLTNSVLLSLAYRF